MDDNSFLMVSDCILPATGAEPKKIVYSCGKCGATDCKLWRLYQTFLEHQELFCITCAGKDQGKDVSGADADGKRPSEYHGVRTDQIGWLVPAVPTPDWTSFWGYSSVPEQDVVWWRSLPTLAAAKPAAPARAPEGGEGE